MGRNDSVSGTQIAFSAEVANADSISWQVGSHPKPFTSKTFRLNFEDINNLDIPARLEAFSFDPCLREEDRYVNVEKTLHIVTPDPLINVDDILEFYERYCGRYFGYLEGVDENDTFTLDVYYTSDIEIAGFNS